MNIDTIYGIKIEKIINLIKRGHELGFLDPNEFIDYLINGSEEE